MPGAKYVPPEPKPLDPSLAPWDRQPKERDTAWAAFLVYRDMPPENRSVNAASKLVDAYNSQLHTWSVIWSWRARVEAHDRYLDQVKVASHRKAIESMTTRHAALANNALGVLQQPIAELVARLNDGRINLSKMSERDLFDLVIRASRAIVALTEVERVSRGLPGKTVGVGVGFVPGATTPTRPGSMPNIPTGATVAEAVLAMFANAGADVNLLVSNTTSADGEDIVDGETTPAP